MDKIRNLSVRKTILLYMTVALICSYILSAFIVGIATRTQMNIWWKYVDKEAFIKEAESKGPYSVTNIPRPNRYEMTKSDCFVTELCDFLETYAILILSMAGSCAAVFLFYRNKLKNPIEELALASKKIAGNNLNFNVTYETKDEMGVLCMEFERMREQLAR
ncbi:MAG: HAMP domain-containing protein, partial [Lachnospiraceae bacterium]|nr:HAMP domain-containing protein [Lachnospiraceae bacterium]